MTEPIGLHGVLVTYLKPQDLTATLRRLDAQTRHLDRLVVVDNGSSLETRQIVESRSGSAHRIEYLDPGENLGPAGGYALGMRHLLDGAGDEDWIFLFDDDDPPFFDDAIENAAHFAVETAGKDPATGGVGISGGRFDAARGRVLRIGDSELSGMVPVDHITAGGLPAYRVRAVRRAGVMRPELFFGFEELDYGLRLSREHRLYADGEQWRERKRVKREAGLLPPEEHSARRTASTSLRLEGVSWRRFYSLRNLVFILRSSGHPWSAIRVAVGRGVLKPLVNLPLSPSVGWQSLKLGWRAGRDGWRGQLGRTLDPPRPGDPG